MNTLYAHVKNYRLFSGTLEDIQPAGKLLINTINQYSYCIAEKDKEFDNALRQSDILLPDGIGIVKAASFLHGQHIRKIAGADLHSHLLESLHKKGGSCFYLGSSERTLAKIKARLAKQYANITVHTYSPPYKATFSEADNAAMVAAVNQHQPDVLFIGLTAPKQEKWAFAHKEALDAGLICTIGAVFDFYAETVKRPHTFWIKMGMEWAVRLVHEPLRLWRRYLYYGPVFVYEICKIKWKKRPEEMGFSSSVNIGAGALNN